MKKYLYIYLAIFISAFSLLLAMSITAEPESEQPNMALEAPSSAEDGFIAAAPIEEDGLIAAAPFDEELAPGAVVELLTKCTLCGHTVKSQRDDLAGITYNELAAGFSGWEVASFGHEGAVLSRELEAYCPRHYVLRYGYEELYIEQYTEDEFAPVRLMELSVVTDALPQELIKKLREGLAFNSLEEIDAFFEALES